MQAEAEGTSFSAESIDRSLELLRQDLLAAPRDVVEEADFTKCAPIDYAALEFEVERMRKRLSIWEVFLRYAGKALGRGPKSRVR
jgi:hypothetical protein